MEIVSGGKFNDLCIKKKIVKGRISAIIPKTTVLLWMHQTAVKINNNIYKAGTIILSDISFANEGESQEGIHILLAFISRDAFQFVPCALTIGLDHFS